MIAPELTTRIADQLARQGLNEATVAVLRAAYPDVHFTYCSDDDITHGKPVLERPRFNLYLVDGGGHCLRLTGDYAAATGLVLAERSGEDED